jgi:replicative superfamily II helicase
MTPYDLINHESPAELLEQIINEVHCNGPTDAKLLHSLSYLKLFHPAIFKKEEGQLLYLLGLFYKTEEAEDIISLAYSIYKEAIYDETGLDLTPVQALIKRHINENIYYSFSAPTSAGKSFVLRDYIKNLKDDVMIVVPSRALIAEYLSVLWEMFDREKEVLLLQFVDNINTKHTKRRIFIVTPERASEIFKSKHPFNISLFLFDEAQISEELHRGIKFDALVNRIDRHYPKSKKVFVHPFVDNPEAQLSKHNFTSASKSQSYQQETVGKIFIHYQKSSDEFYYFSPFIDNCHHKSNKVRIDKDIVYDTLKNNGCVLIYIYKSNIYSQIFEEKFSKYLDICTEITNPEAIDIISEISELVGAKKGQSKLVELMKRGIVIHHGSIPLSVRFLLEKFTRKGFAKLCFATSTLSQGINMPFDLVWVDNLKFPGSENERILELKNLIGRAGRSTLQKNAFDYGYVVVNNIKLFSERINEKSSISGESQLDKDWSGQSEDFQEFADSVKKNEIDEELNLPKSKIERLRSNDVFDVIKTLLSNLFINNEIITAKEYKNLDEQVQKDINPQCIISCRLL